MDTSDNVTIAGDLTVSGNDITFGATAKITDGNGYITSLSISGGTEDAGTYSISIQGTGDLTLA